MKTDNKPTQDECRHVPLIDLTSISFFNSVCVRWGLVNSELLSATLWALSRWRHNSVQGSLKVRESPEGKKGMKHTHKSTQTHTCVKSRRSVHSSSAALFSVYGLWWGSWCLNLPHHHTVSNFCQSALSLTLKGSNRQDPVLQGGSWCYTTRPEFIFLSKIFCKKWILQGTCDHEWFSRFREKWFKVRASPKCL